MTQIKITGSLLQPVLETLEYFRNETDVWLGITTLLITGLSDGKVPLPFTAFHPGWRILL